MRQRSARERELGLGRRETGWFYPTVKLVPATVIGDSATGALRSDTNHAEGIAIGAGLVKPKTDAESRSIKLRFVWLPPAAVLPA